jgi:WhiB family redox-sensing transcriptional regulator
MRHKDADTDWMVDGLCRQVDPDLFFPDAGANGSLKARRVCSSCPVMDECLSYALDHPGILGVWGGTTESQRQSMIRRARRAA